ncbi:MULTISPECIES: hypothetical protein [Citromicrobium]|uniref:hypothetical protein n=1 Tax=Citromicrobium TaxID=72173 RepID=UPI0012E14723|nr:MULTISPECIES: hypothetical protein [Citromicrobium]
MIDRRSILGGSVLGAGAFGIAAFTGRDLLTGRNATLASATARSQLRIPPLYSGERKSGERVFDLNLRHGVSRFFEGIETPTIGGVPTEQKMSSTSPPQPRTSENWPKCGPSRASPPPERGSDLTRPRSRTFPRSHRRLFQRNKPKF